MNEEAQISHEFTVAYEPAMAGRAARLYWRKTHFADFLTVLASVAFAAIVLASGHVAPWVAWLLLSAAALLLVLQVAVYLVQRQRSLRIIEKMQVRSTTWRMSDEELELGNQWGQSRLKWPLVKGILAGPDMWLVMMHEGGYMTLPLEGVPEAALEFMKERVLATGGRVN